MEKLLLDPESARRLEAQLRDANLKLAHQREVPLDVDKLIRNLSRDVVEIPASEAKRIDPYLLLTIHQGVLLARHALDLDKPAQQRRLLRVALEKLRQAVRDVIEGIPTNEDQAAKDVVRWLVEALDVPQAHIARVLGVHPRKFQRWVSPTDPTEPHDEDALRVRVVARITSNLRHSFSGPGVVAWLERPHPELKGKAPKQLLDKRQNLQDLTSLAAAARSSAAT